MLFTAFRLWSGSSVFRRLSWPSIRGLGILHGLTTVLFRSFSASYSLVFVSFLVDFVFCALQGFSFSVDAPFEMTCPFALRCSVSALQFVLLERAIIKDSSSCSCYSFKHCFFIPPQASSGWIARKELLEMQKVWLTTRHGRWRKSM